MGGNEIVIGAEKLREEIKVLNKKLWEFADLCKKTEQLKYLDGTPGHGEAIANAILSYRHGEDCRMRLGKVLEACGENYPA